MKVYILTGGGLAAVTGGAPWRWGMSLFMDGFLTENKFSQIDQRQPVWYIQLPLTKLDKMAIEFFLDIT